MPDDGPVLLYDGTCGLCASSVRFLLDRDRDGTLRFAARDSAFGRSLRDRHRGLEAIDSVVWVEPASDRVWTHSGAALRALAGLGGPWRLVRLALLIPVAVRDAVYRVIARHRHRLRGDACLVPGEKDRGRFLP